MTALAASGRDPDSEPTVVARIYSELVSLRKGYGLTYENLRGKKQATRIKQLVAVHDEMLRTRTSDRALAAHAVIKCAIFREIRDPHFSQILIRSYNLDGCGGNVTERFDSLYDLLGVSGKNNRDKKIRTAHFELAAILAAAESSPCRGGGIVRAQEVLDLSVESLLRDTAKHTLKDLIEPGIRQVLQAMVSSTPFAGSEEIAEGALKVLPRLAPHVAAFESPSQAFRFALNALYRYHHTPLTPSPRSGYELTDLQCRACLAEPTLMYKFDWDVANLNREKHLVVTPHVRFSWRRRPVGHGRNKRSWRPYLINNETSSVSMTYWDAKSDFLGWLARVVFLAERNDQWSDIFGTSMSEIELH